MYFDYILCVLVVPLHELYAFDSDSDSDHHNGGGGAMDAAAGGALLREMSAQQVTCSSSSAGVHAKRGGTTRSGSSRGRGSRGRGRGGKSAHTVAAPVAEYVPGKRYTLKHFC